MEKITSMIVGWGIPGLILLVAVEASGLAGAAAITVALAAIGPGGMIGGVATLVAAGLILAWLSEFGFDAIFSSVMCQLYARGESRESLIRKIERYPVSKKLKSKLIREVEGFGSAAAC